MTDNAPDVVESVARAIARAHGIFDEDEVDSWREEARAAIEALAANVTPRMVDAAKSECGFDDVDRPLALVKDESVRKLIAAALRASLKP